MYFHFISIFNIVLFFIAYFYEIDEFEIFVYFPFVLQIVLYIFSTKKKEQNEFSWASPSLILIFCLCIVFLQIIINVQLGIGSLSYYLRTTGYEAYITPCLYLSLLCISSFMYGAYNYLDIFTNKGGGQNQIIKTYSIKPWYYLALLSFIFFIVTIDINSFMSGLDYRGSGAYDRTKGTYATFENFFNVFALIYISLISYKIRVSPIGYCSFRHYFKEVGLLFWITMSIYIVLRALSGERGALIMNLMMIAYSLIFCTKIKVKLIYVIVLLGVGAVLMTLMNYTRGLDLEQTYEERFTESINNQDDFNMESISPYTQQLAWSAVCNFVAIKDIDTGKIKYQYGIYSLYGLLSSIPGFSFILNKYFNVNIRDLSVGEYLTMSYYDTQFYDHGLGATSLSGLYLDFGVIGCLIFFFIMGLLYKHIDKVIFRNKFFSIFILIFCLKLAAMVIITSRSTFIYAIDKGIYGLIIFILGNFIFSRFNNSYKVRL